MLMLPKTELNTDRKGLEAKNVQRRNISERCARLHFRRHARWGRKALFCCIFGHLLRGAKAGAGRRPRSSRIGYILIELLKPIGLS